MTEDPNPVDAALRKLVGDPQPTPQDREIGQRRLRRAIETESADANVGWSRKLVWVAAFTLLMLGTIYIALRPAQVEAATEEIASAAEAVDPLTLPENKYLYTRSEVANLTLVPSEALGEIPFKQSHLVYLLPAIRETWVASDGTIQIRTQNQPPVFFTTEAETAYYNSELNEIDAIEATITETFPPPESPETWPTDIEALDQAIRARTVDRNLSDTIEYLDVAVDILRENPITPQLRGNTIRLIGRLPDLEAGQTGDQLTTLTTEYEDDGIETEYALTLDHLGHLVSERTTIKEANRNLGIPAGTTISTARYLTSQVVSDLDSR